MDDVNIKKKTKSAFEILWPLVTRYMRPYIGQLALAMLFMLVAAAATASFAKLLQPVLDKAMIGVQHDPSTIHVILPLGAICNPPTAQGGVPMLVLEASTSAFDPAQRSHW